MKTQNTKNWRNVAVSAAVLLAFCFPMLGKAAGQGGTGFKGFHNCSERPLSDFLGAQGSTSIFFPPVQDMYGWVDGSFINFGLVDYAGLANEYLEGEGISLGTTVSGTVTECNRGKGEGEGEQKAPAKISVVLYTENALGFAQSIADLDAHGFDFLATPTIFGNKAQDVANGAVPALGPAVLRTTFFIAAPGDPLPDIRIAFDGNQSDLGPITLDFESTTVGTLPDGTTASLYIHQVGAAKKGREIVYTKEIVDINSD